MMTPYEKFRSLPETKCYLKPSTALEKLDTIAAEYSDNEAAQRLNNASTTPGQHSFNQLKIPTKRRLNHFTQTTFAQAHVWIGKYCPCFAF